MMNRIFQNFLGRGVTVIPQNTTAFPFGNLYTGSSWASTSYFTASGNTSCSISASTVVFGGGNTNHTSYLTLGYGSTLLNKWNCSMNVAIGITGSSNVGFGFGVTSTNAVAQYNLYADYNPNTGQILINNNAVATGALPKHNDIIQLTVDLNQNILSVTASNLMSGGTIQGNYTYTTVAGTSTFLPNTGKFSIFTLGNAQYSLRNFVLQTSEYKYASIVLIGDSQTVGYNADSEPQSWARQMQTNYTYVTIHAGGSDRTTEILQTVGEIINFAPKRALLQIGANDAIYGSSEGTYEANYTSIVNQLLSASIDVYYALPFPENANDLTAHHNFITGSFPSNKQIDYWNLLRSGSHGLSSSYDAGDGIHFNQNGHNAVYNYSKGYFGVSLP